jgi:hypothetical protein
MAKHNIVALKFCELRGIAGTGREQKSAYYEGNGFKKAGHSVSFNG